MDPSEALILQLIQDDLRMEEYIRREAKVPEVKLPEVKERISPPKKDSTLDLVIVNKASIKSSSVVDTTTSTIDKKDEANTLQSKKARGQKNRKVSLVYDAVELEPKSAYHKDYLVILSTRRKVYRSTWSMFQHEVLECFNQKKFKIEYQLMDEYTFMSCKLFVDVSVSCGPNESDMTTKTVELFSLCERLSKEPITRQAKVINNHLLFNARMRFLLETGLYVACINKNCSVLFHKNLVKPDQLVCCVHCHDIICLACKVSVKEHRDMTCQQYKQYVARRKDPYVKQLFLEGRVQPCPGCNELIERIDGCNHMTCETSGCRMHWCWACGLDNLHTRYKQSDHHFSSSESRYKGRDGQQKQCITADAFSSPVESRKMIARRNQARLEQYFPSVVVLDQQHLVDEKKDYLYQNVADRRKSPNETIAILHKKGLFNPLCKVVVFGEPHTDVLTIIPSRETKLAWFTTLNL
jgi:hypothetical protein